MLRLCQLSHMSVKSWAAVLVYVDQDMESRKVQDQQKFFQHSDVRRACAHKFLLSCRHCEGRLVICQAVDLAQLASAQQSLLGSAAKHLSSCCLKP